MAGDKFERVEKNLTLKVYAYITQVVVRRADESRERAKRTRTISTHSPFAETAF